jgi:hypothetical protein
MIVLLQDVTGQHDVGGVHGRDRKGKGAGFLALERENGSLIWEGRFAFEPPFRSYQLNRPGKERENFLR